LGSSSANYFSGTDAERLQDLQEMMDDDNVQAVLCARGGYGIGRIIDQLDFRKFIRRPKWLVGYSDVTVLHAHVYSNFKLQRFMHPWRRLSTMADPGTNMCTH
jgi:muramoyltetrapeptide carboxypeptidase